MSIYVDPAALYRQQELITWQDRSQEHNYERVANNFDICYRYLGGNIGIMSNGAGTSMATCDLVTAYGGKPANFVDLGGSVIHEQIHEIITLLEQDPNVKVVFINCFGGLLRTDKIVATFENAIKHGNITKPLVMRLHGTSHERAHEMSREWKDPSNKFGAKFEDYQIFWE